MSQQINLYQPIFRAQKKVFSAITIVQIAGVFVLGLMAIYGFARWQVATLEDEVAELEQRRDTAIAQLQDLSAAVPAPARANLIEDQLRDARIDHDHRTRLLDALEARDFGDTRGFSDRLTGLARQRIDGLWLTRVVLRDGAVELEGAAEVGELLPRYVTRLGRESSFAGTEFARYELKRGEGPGDPVRFSLSTGSTPPEGGSR